jgi:hypothetical protein
MFGDHAPQSHELPSALTGNIPTPPWRLADPPPKPGRQRTLSGTRNKVFSLYSQRLGIKPSLLAATRNKGRTPDLQELKGLLTSTWDVMANHGDFLIDKPLLARSREPALRLQ